MPAPELREILLIGVDAEGYVTAVTEDGTERYDLELSKSMQTTATRLLETSYLEVVLLLAPDDKVVGCRQRRPSTSEKRR